MIQLLKDYYDKKGHRYKVMSYSGGNYMCESYDTGVFMTFKSNELFATPPKKRSSFSEALVDSKKQTEKPSAPQYNFKDEDTKAAIRRELEEAQAEIKKRKTEQETKIVPKVEEETKIVPKVEEETKIVPKVEDNIKETADDFYADF